MPYTIFGPTRVVVYIGNMFFVFVATEQIRALTRHFDELIRAAVVQPPTWSTTSRPAAAPRAAKIAQAVPKAKAA